MNDKKQRITFVVPARNEERNIRCFYEETNKIVLGLDNYIWEFIFIDDGSNDSTWQTIKEISNLDPTVKGVRLSRNFGKEMALTAGILEQTKFPDAVIFMDADLQHPPAAIPKLIQQWELGFQIVTAQRKSIRYSLWREMGSNFFFFMLNRFSKLNIQYKATDFRLLDHKVLEVLQTFPERNRFFRGIIDWMGFEKSSITFDSPDRITGKSTFTFNNLFSLAVNSFTSFSLMPLRITGYLGLAVTTVSSLLFLYMIITHLILGLTIFTKLAYFVVFNTLLFGIVLAALGLIALYIGNIHTEVSGRPLYIVQERVGFVKQKPL
ncbi:MAG: glycosyltransferase family 2 protein [Nitrospina sp.]|jgi:polyisoprenyl-phosphate glycosyltransferase|nr:glycosyltransferase family 2 protein [Nitrospina sp.]MBT6600939.1 glycosyltransferase family 2 protein [Nitrospina sp.]